MTISRKTPAGVTYHLQDEGGFDNTLSVMHFIVERVERAGVVLPNYDVWAIVERKDYAFYVILQPMKDGWPALLHYSGAENEGVPIADVVAEAFDAYVAKHVDRCIPFS